MSANPFVVKVGNVSSDLLDAEICNVAFAALGITFRWRLVDVAHTPPTDQIVGMCIPELGDQIETPISLHHPPPKNPMSMDWSYGVLSRGRQVRHGARASTRCCLHRAVWSRR